MNTYTKKDIIKINKEIGETGQLNNGSSLDFVLGTIQDRKSWLHQLSYLVRAFVTDHIFTDGNKRTCIVICALYFNEYNQKFDKQELINIIKRITINKESNIHKIARELRKCWI